MAYSENNKFSISASVVIIVFALIFSFSLFQRESQGQIGEGCPTGCSWIGCDFPSEDDCEIAIAECHSNEDCPTFECVFNSNCLGNQWEAKEQGNGGGGTGTGTCEIRGWAWGESSPE